jgi:hypothetical protein
MQTTPTIPLPFPGIGLITNFTHTRAQSFTVGARCMHHMIRSPRGISHRMLVADPALSTHPRRLPTKHQLLSSFPCPPPLPSLLSPACSSPSSGARTTLKPSTPWVSTYRPYSNPPPPPIPIPTQSTPYPSSFPLSATPSRTGHRGLKTSSSRANQTSCRPRPCWKKCRPAHPQPGFTSLRPRASPWYAKSEEHASIYGALPVHCPAIGRQSSPPWHAPAPVSFLKTAGDDTEVSRAEG